MITQSQAQSMQAINAAEITYLESELADINKHIKEIYEICDPANPHTEQAFRYLNYARDQKRAIKKVIKVKANFQKMLKNIRANPYAFLGYF